MQRVSSSAIAMRFGVLVSLTGSLSCTEPTETGPSSSEEADSSSLPLRDAGASDAMAFLRDASAQVEGGSAGEELRVSLISHARWQELTPVEDPFDDRPEGSTCARGGFMRELLGAEEAFSVDTGRCPYVTVTQSMLRDVAPGDLLKVRLWHFELTAPEPAEAHVAVIVDGVAVLDARLPIPAPGGLVASETRVERAIFAGAPVYFHLHNHGTNSWSLVELSAGP